MKVELGGLVLLALGVIEGLCIIGVRGSVRGGSVLLGSKNVVSFSAYIG
jgi:hypothetical protein